MKKTFLTRRNAILSSAGIPWGGLAIFLVLIALFLRLLAPNFFLGILAPLYRAADAVAEGSNYFISGFKNTAELSIRNLQLQEENTALANENKALRQKEKAIAELGGSGIIAGVVARPPESPYDTLVLAVGEKDGVTLGMEAFGAGGVPLGIVSSLSADFSRITLFSAPHVSVNGWVGDNSIPLTLYGAGAGAFSATAPRTANIAVGDTVFLPEPGALPIGKIARIDSDLSLPSVTLHISPALNIFSITWVILRTTGAVFSGVPVCATSTP